MFKAILGAQWGLVCPSVTRHYGIKDGEKIEMKGLLAVRHGKFIKPLMPLIRLTGALVPVEGDDFIVTVENIYKNRIFYWKRIFEKNGKKYVFNSKMMCINNQLVEFVGLGIGIRLNLKVENGGIVFTDGGYVIKLGSLLLPLPIRWLVGHARIHEFANANNANEFKMQFILHHPWFGFAFSYHGVFSIIYG